MSDASQHSEFFPEEIRRDERPEGTSRVDLPPELSAALRKVLEKLRQFLPEFQQLSKKIGRLPFYNEGMRKIAKPEVERDKLESRLYYLGGDGNAAHWEWLVFKKKGGSRVIASGIVKGQRQQAEFAAREASIEYCEKLKSFRLYRNIAS